METHNTFEDIIEGFRRLAEENKPIDPHLWLSGALKLNSLLPSEMDTLITLEHGLAVMRKRLLEEGNNATYTKLMIEAAPEYMEVQRQKARIANANAQILLCKKYATLTSDLMRSNMN